jgi:2-phospho-L-lactate/phosphoenolpyruvate guanylyltransferase
LKGLAVLVPFKSKDPKSRLSKVLSASQRSELAVIMLEGVIDAIRSAGLQKDCYLISSDPEAASVAKGSGISLVPEPSDRGVNAAVSTGIGVLENYESFLVVPSDLALVKATDVRRAMKLGSHLDCMISPSRSFNGTNLLQVSKNIGFTLSYDSNSFWNHVGEAARKGLRLAVLCSNGVLFDVDSPEDLRELSRARSSTPAVRFAKEAVSKWAS